jgi:hypothetical protein
LKHPGGVYFWGLMRPGTTNRKHPSSVLRLLWLTACCYFSVFAKAQAPDTPVQPKKRIALVAGLNVAAYTGSLIALNEAWYKGYPRTSFHTFDDSKEWLQVDKTGHAWTAYTVGKYSADIWQWAGLPHKKAVWIGGLSGAGYLTVIELLDAHSARWGWSWSDMGANVLGSGLFISQELLWKEQRVQFKFSTHPKSYNVSLRPRTDDLFGKSLPEKTLKDYNGQTYWLSFNMRSFLPESNLPSWLNISVGYGAEGMVGGFENKWANSDGSITTRYDVERRRQFYIAPDIDLTKIKTRNKAVRTLLNVLNSVKVPAPTLEFSKGKVRGHWLYF